jgi:glutathione synthase/RimK-type ligase-like ATP-grasp enzyme
MRIACLLDRRAHEMPTPLLESVFARLERRGMRVDWMVPEERLIRTDVLAPEYDLYLLKSQSELALSLGAILHARGARLVNRYPACAAVRDKVVAAGRLRAAGIPAPRTWVTQDLGLVESLLADGPLVVKPPRGLHGAGVHVLRRPADLAAVPPPASPQLVQDYVAGGPDDLKLYVVGGAVFGVRKPFSGNSFSAPGRPCEVPAEARDVALRCGRAFGLSLYGLDVIESADGPVVVDVNYFPGYRGIAGADEHVADHLERVAAAA